MNTQYMMTTELTTLAGYLGEADVIAFDFETAPIKAWTDDKKAALNPHKAEIVPVTCLKFEPARRYTQAVLFVGESFYEYQAGVYKMGVEEMNSNPHIIYVKTYFTT